MKKRRKIIAVILLLVLLIPYPRVYKDGGTVELGAILYKAIRWHTLDLDSPTGFKTGFELHFFPTNFFSIDHYR